MSKDEMWDLVEMVVYGALMVFVLWTMGAENDCGLVIMREVVC